MGDDHLRFLKELDRNDGIDPLPPDWYYLPVEEHMGSEDVIGAQAWPGFTPDLTRWKLWVSDSGWLSVLVTHCRPYEKVLQKYELARHRIGTAEVRRLQHFADSIGFPHLAPTYDLDITDGSTETIVVRRESQLKRVMCSGNEPTGFRAFWRRIHRHAPVVGRYMPWWARGWCGRLFDSGRS